MVYAKTKVQQLSRDGKHISKQYRPDKVLTKTEILQLVKQSLGKSVAVVDKYSKKRILVIKYSAEGKNVYMTVSNITYMGKGRKWSNPLDLKRIQLQPWFRELYNEHIYEENTEIKFIGIYSFSKKHIFVDFRAEDYMKRDWKTCVSTHIYLNDLYQGYNNNLFSKIDKDGNHITVINNKFFASYIHGNKIENSIVSKIEEISSNIPAGWITAKDAIIFMRSLEHDKKDDFTSFNNWRQNLWNGWIVEAYYSKLASHYVANQPVTYIDTCDEERIHTDYRKYDLDLLLTDTNTGEVFLGDLKGVSINVSLPAGETLLNDERHVNEALKKYKKIWFVFYIQDSKPGKTNNYEMVKWRNMFIEKVDGKPRDKLSARNTPHSIRIKEIVVLELNDITKDKYFKIGKQWGKNSDGRERNLKYKIPKKLLQNLVDDSFVIYRKRINE